MKILYSFFIFLLFAPYFAFAVSYDVGVSPPVVEAYDIGKGQDKIVKFFIVTSSPETFLVQLEKDNGNLDFFKKDIYKKYLLNYSEETTKDWVQILENPARLEPSFDQDQIKALREINFLLKVPENAEPGYHIVNIKPFPRFDGNTTGTVGTQVVAVTSVNVLFRVPGDALRKGIILDTVMTKSENSVLITSYFQNIGTVTVTAKPTHKIIDSGGILIGEFPAPSEKVAPKGIYTFSSTTPAEILDASGNYTVNTVVDYVTDTASRNFDLVLTQPLKPLVVAKAETSYMWLLVLIVILVVIFYFIMKRRRR